MTEIIVENIKCGGCANSISNSLSKIEGIKNINIDIENGKVAFESDHDIKEIVAKKLLTMGYPEPGNGSGLTTAKSFVSCMVGRMS